MNTNSLAKLYGQLTPRERIPLLLAAEARGDDLEQRRLDAAAPRKLWKLPDYLLPSMALDTLTLLYLTEQLDHLASYWHALGRLTTEEDENSLDWWLVADTSAYVFCCNVEAWRRFCDGLKLDAALLTARNYSGWIVPYCQNHMPNAAPSRDELRARLRAYGVEEGEPLTADDLLAKWQRLFDACTQRGIRAHPPGEQNDEQQQSG